MALEEPWSCKLQLLVCMGKRYSIPKNLPIKEEFLTKMFKVVDRFVKPNTEEVEFNPRSRSAKLSILEKVNENND